MPDFQSRDPADPAFWDERFERHFIPWDRGGVPLALQDFVACAAQPLVTFIPGCGSGHEVAFLSQAGWDVSAIDFSPAAVAAARAVLGPWADRVTQADFFDYVLPRSPQLVYERAFLCALPRAQWPAVAARWAALLSPGGLLAGFFYFDDAPGGPPFGASTQALGDLLAPCFEQVEDAAVDDSLPVFAGKERWQVWRRK